MIEIKCPRCQLYWYSDNEDEGSVRLCSACAEELRRHRGQPIHIDVPFLIAVALFLLVDAILIVLTALWPGTFGMLVLVYGLALFVVGLRVFRRTSPGHIGDTNWTVARWPGMIALNGLACVLAAFSFAILPKH